MATVINNPSTETSTGNGVVIGILAVVLLGILFLVFGLPYLRNSTAPASNNGGASINVDLPGNNGGTSGGATSGQ